MNVDRVKKENRKAIPKFLLILLVSALVGGVLGFGVGYAGHSDLPQAVTAVLTDLLRAITPWAIPVGTAALLGPALVIYRSAKGRFAAWDGEDEQVVDAAEESLSWVLLLTALSLILNFFFLAAATDSLFATGAMTPIVVIVSFLVSVALATVLQQKVVDQEKRMNPEKQGSVYDMKFQKKWLESCDEAEQHQIGQAAYRAFRTGTTACIALWMALVMLNMIFGFGLLPVAVTMVIWAVLQVSYTLECIRLSRGKR